MNCLNNQPELIGDIMERLGFNKKAPESTVRAFVRSLGSSVKKKSEQLELFNNGRDKQNVRQKV